MRVSPIKKPSISPINLYWKSVPNTWHHVMRSGAGQDGLRVSLWNFYIVKKNFPSDIWYLVNMHPVAKMTPKNWFPWGQSRIGQYVIRPYEAGCGVNIWGTALLLMGCHAPFCMYVTGVTQTMQVSTINKSTISANNFCHKWVYRPCEATCSTRCQESEYPWN